MSNLRTQEVEMLLEVLSAMDDKDQLYALIEDLFTIREIKETSQRLSVAQLLSQGKPYTAIAEITGASATTIARVSKALNYGSGGYRLALDVLNGKGSQGDEPDAE
ncbi:YerC/YecD family TrpR-related protein [Slackia heliotrinireducens]|jgi:TrpR-related protein YerC/YecD|uniref:TrpR-related protein YerC/YecD n=1 Tax=Slackia heliotrinireducens (strain ATCC 29202 / DSM 20476 / NCTC 11029 / RHS 1) TaxID=471855 RepID=C7N1D6_SLAHD|nr:YerC/YecD family TrpR-related protein [Slackia heliotrinireducens]ACV21228.1 TrpR-related protein YerC/YecD [Slackia heliotrinireducens DSM 20476]